MNDANATEKGSSCLAITEKKKKNNQRPSGGCIGVFFQLFDWNRRLTKKRFFSKKLLPPPARAKQGSSKKFKGDEKMPKSKLHLNANENNGGFLSAKKGGNRVIEVEQKHEMRVPGLVARLMGLESIPASQRDKIKKSNSFSDGDDHTSEADNKQGVDLENGVGVNARHDSTRPQKLQKTGAYERRVVTRFGAEGLQIKSVLSQVRKYNHHHHNHHPKLVSPLKSPRISSGKSASRSSRLIEAATKILEPASRAKCSLTSSSTSIYPPNNNGIVTEMVGIRPAHIQNQSGYDASTDKSFMGHNSCENCGNLLDVVGYRPEVEVEISTPIVSDVFSGSSLESAQNGRSLFIPSHENDVVLLRNQEKIIIVDNEDEDGKNNAQSCNESTKRKTHVPTKWDSSQQLCRALEDDGASSSFVAFKHKTQTQERVLSSDRITSAGSRTSNMQEKTVSSATSTVSGTKDFVALNRSLGGRTTRTRSPTKVDSCKFDLERKPSNRKDNNSSSRLSNLERKRRTPNVSQVEGGTASVNLVTAKHRNVGSDAQGGKRRNFDASPPNNSNVKSKRGGQLRTDKINDNKVVSSAFSSPLKQKIVIPGGKEETSRDNEIKTYFQRPSPPLRADALGAFLEQKLKELSSRENEELAAGGQPKRSTAMILQELISFLNSEQLTCCDDHMFNDKDHKFEANHARLLGTSCYGNHLSPGSVLEASFSSSSLDEGLGHGFHPESINYSYDQLEQLENDAKLLDSAASFNKGKKIGCVILTELVNQIHRMLQSISSFWTRLTETKLNHMKEVIFNAELVIGNVITGYNSEDDGVSPQLLISCFLLNELDTMASSDAMWRDFFNGFVGCEEPKNRSQQLKGFLFDCVIEYLESNCCQHYNSIFKSWSAWTKLPLCAKAEVLAQEVKSEIKKWACIAGNMVPDQIIEWEMSHSLGKWNDFNVEAFEAGVDIDGDVLQILVDEIVEDLVDSRPRSCY